MTTGRGKTTKNTKRNHHKVPKDGPKKKPLPRQNSLRCNLPKRGMIYPSGPVMNQTRREAVVARGLRKLMPNLDWRSVNARFAQAFKEATTMLQEAGNGNGNANGEFADDPIALIGQVKMRPALLL